MKKNQDHNMFCKIYLIKPLKNVKILCQDKAGIAQEKRNDIFCQDNACLSR